MIIDRYFSWIFPKNSTLNPKLFRKKGKHNKAALFIQASVIVPFFGLFFVQNSMIKIAKIHEKYQRIVLSDAQANKKITNILFKVLL